MSRPICKDCKKSPATRNGSKKNGMPKWKTLCSQCNKKKYVNKFKYKLTKSSFCNLCGFVPVHECQLDVDHIDGNYNNNTPDNLQTLCANCHRLKTYINADWLDKEEINISTYQLGLEFEDLL